MINTMKMRLIFPFVLLIYSLICQADGGKDSYIFRKVDYQQGLSNSAVLCLFQDNTGLMWFGTYDGVNCYDGRSMEVFRSDFSAPKALSNNVIHSIQQADNNCLWISTHLGINRLSQNSRQVVGYYDFTDDYYLHSNSKGNTWVVSHGGIFYYNTSYKRFVQIKNLKVPVEDMDKRAFVTDDGVLWIFTQQTGELLQVSQDAFDCDTLSIHSTVSSTNFHAKPIEDVFYQNGVLCFIDSEHDLYVYDISRQSKIYIRNLSSLVQKNGTIAGIALFYEDIIIGFRTNGLVRLRTSQKYKEEVVDRNVRIYSIYGDPHQNVLWVASDGQGTIMYAKKYSIATNLMLNQLSSNLSRQVRSVMTDNSGGLWFGTKGDGLLHIPDYRENEEASAVTVYSPEGKQNVVSYIRWNKEFPVYKLVQSRYMDGFWIGSGDPGLFYYSFEDKALHSVENLPAQPTEIHGIYEENDSVLYVVTAGSGFHKLILEKQAGTIRFKSQKSYHFFHGQREITMFYPMLPEGDSILWLGSREKGLVRFDKRTEEYKVISLKEMLHKSVDDVLSLYRTKEGLLYVGTTSGLVCLNSNGKQMKATYIGREQGLLNDMIHGVLEDENGLLWLGTNRGLIKYNPINGSSHAYFYSAGVQIGEFSDDAYYMCPYTQELFFGGIDGLLYLDKEVQAAPEFYPDILLRKLTVGHTQVVQGDGDYYTDDGKALQLKGTEVSFALSFVVPDFLSGEDIEYSYQLEGYDKDWTSFSSINEASYTGVPAGDYIFKVRYKRDVFDTEYRHFSIPVYILSPWYRSVAAYFVYLVIFLLLLGYVIYLLRKNYLQERMMKTLMGTESCRKSETVYTNRRMLEDFTLIYNYCDQLRAENLSYEQCLEKVSLIRETVMNALLNPDALFLEELKQFFPDRFIVSARMSIQGVSQEVLRTLEEQGIDHSSISSMIPEHLTFPVYKNALYSILYCCYLRITEMKGTHGVIVEMSEQDGKMQLHFSSKDATAKALYEYLSDKASSVTEKDSDHVFAVHLLLGFVRSALERIHAVLRYDDDESGSRLTIIFEPAVLTVAGEQGKKTVLLLEDRDEMTWLISNFLADEYVVHQVKSVQLAFDEIRRSAPALLLVDMTMYANAESTFMEYVSRNRTLLSKTAFIPLLTWKVGSAIQRELILWSDSYIVLPYDILFLREVVHNAIYGKREAKQIYMEELGDLAGQIVCTTTEQADFIRKLLKVIEENLDKEELGSTLIADRMAMSSRQFYRKFKEISNTAPGDLIKSYRMEKAARLLLDEELSIQDVIMEVGISSRSYFYKEFTRRFGMTPKDYREQRKVC